MVYAFLLSVVSVSQKTECCTRPRLDIIQPFPETCEEISSDALTVRGFQENECRDYRLGEKCLAVLPFCPL